MATYFHGNPADIQAAAAADHGGLQTLVLMNPAAYVHYSADTTTAPPPPNNLLFLNSNSSLSPHAPPSPHTQQFVGIPLPSAASNQDNNISPLHGLVHRLHYNMYNAIDPSGEARDSPRAHHQGLSLSLSSQHQQQPAGNYGSEAHQAISGEDMRVSGTGGSGSSGETNNGMTGVQSVSLLSSKYLKAAQEVLDEVVSVNNNNTTDQLAKKGSTGNNNNSNSSNKAAAGDSSAVAGGDGDAGGGKSGAELTTAERQEIQMKKAKLISMLNEVDQRYRQYQQQMQIVVSSFEQAAGIGSAKTYTAVALKTISKQFRCLKDAISGEIQAANKSLGEEEDCVVGKMEGSRLKFVDHHLRQQRALQQLGMIHQHNAWRPQRGLPERSVSVLRAWLFEHFLHPYPKDSDKIMLAKQTGLTRSQVSNWFINARVRLWKPMVEEMYNEEIKEHEQQNDSEDNKTRKKQNNENAEKSAAENQTKSFSSEQDNNPTNNNQSISTASMSSLAAGNVRNQPSGFSLLGSSELEGLTQGSPKKPRSTEMLQSPTSVQSINMDFKQSETTNNEVAMKIGKDGYSFMGTTNTNFMGSFGQYPIGEIGRFDAEQFAPRFSGNGVSLTLGLPHCENLSLSGAQHHHQTFIPNQNMPMGGRSLDIAIGEPNEFGAINPSTPHSSAAFESINIQNRKGFAAQLLPDFVA